MALDISDSTPNSIKAVVNYYAPAPDGGPPDLYYLGTAGSRRRKYEPHRVRITDLRGLENDFTLDRNAFQLVHHVSQEKSFDDEARIQRQYWPEVEKLMRDVTGASHAFCFNTIVRRDSKEKERELLKNAADSDQVQVEAPATFAHIDQSYRGADILLESIIESMPPDANTLADVAARSSRWAIVNAWRPLKPITREPLAVCDAQSVPDTDLREVTVRLNEEYIKNRSPGDKKSVLRDNKLWQLAHSPRHKWYWPKEQRPDEVMLIKCFDSAKDVARRAPHCAIQTPLDRGPARESIEARCLLFWEDGGVKARL